MSRHSGLMPSARDHYEPRDRRRRRRKKDPYHYSAAFMRETMEVTDKEESRACSFLFKSLFWFMPIVLSGLLVAILVIYTLAIKDNSASIDPDSIEFQLYKNTRFQECSSQSSSAVECTFLQYNLATDSRGFTDFSPNPSENYMVKLWLPADRSDYEGARYTWCDVASCLSGFKVIPSTPRPAAFYTLSLTTTLLTTMTIWSASWWMFKLFTSDPDECGEGLGKIFWVLAIFDTVTVAFWWVSLFMFMQASNPLHFVPLSVLNWVTVWRYARSLHFHPVKCAFEPDSTPHRVLMWVLYLLTVAQWIASCVVFGLYYGDIVSMFGRGRYARYDCHEDRIDAAPGASSCSSAELCSKDWLLGDPGFEQSVYYGDLLVAIFWISTVVALAPILGLVFEGFRRLYRDQDFFPSKTSRFLKKWSSNASLEFVLLGLFFAVFVLDILTIVDIFRETGDNDRAGTFAFDLSCRAVHVSLSPWKYFLDINEFERAFKIAKTWFNV
ncbi:uncharacterized protein F4817DRAFT_368116 [Daldinia loculata]|uniref:uncharacterized protein n=1 Tax=Daldinia loculata TaxID=103429 RepID=UPI0020C3B821|nr:uncharacterized protein F4817DRAFT_368116 [Daldinia loculata]KAI1650744.1 hypothetical protein F4817DRAFT_368116 [Daldinia loculata]